MRAACIRVREELMKFLSSTLDEASEDQENSE